MTNPLASLAQELSYRGGADMWGGMVVVVVGSFTCACVEGRGVITCCISRVNSAMRFGQD